MRSEKEQMTAGKETKPVELQLRDIPGEQEHTPGSAKHKEEKKEVFSKVMGPSLGGVSQQCLHSVRGGEIWWSMEGGGLGSAPRTATARRRRIWTI